MSYPLPIMVASRQNPLLRENQMKYDPIAYAYEADYHCPGCAEERFGRSPRGFIAEDATDREGNSVGVIAPWDEWADVTVAGLHTLECGTCHGVIETLAVECDECGTSGRVLEDGDEYPCECAYGQELEQALREDAKRRHPGQASFF